MSSENIRLKMLSVGRRSKLATEERKFKYDYALGGNVRLSNGKSTISCKLFIENHTSCRIFDLDILLEV